MIRAIGRMLGTAWRASRGRTLTAGALTVVGAVATPLVAVGLASLTREVVAGNTTSAALAGLAVAVAAVAALVCAHFSHVAYFELAELTELDFDRELADLSHGPPGIAHHERPDLADRFTVLQRETRQFHTGLGAVLSLGGLAVAMAVTVVLLAQVSPLLLLFPLAVAPPLIAARLAERIQDRARTGSAENTRVARNLFGLSTSVRYAGELRIFGLGAQLRRRHDTLWRAATDRLWAGHLRSAWVRAAGQGLFALAYCGAVLVAVRQAVVGGGDLGGVVLVVALAMQVNHQITAAVALVRDLYRIASAYRHVDELRAELLPPTSDADRDPPPRLTQGITFDGVSFVHPGADRAALREVRVSLPAGSTVAVIGDNGAGKSTFVKVLCGLYEPTAGRILIDGVDQRRFPVHRWRERMAVGFQDFVRFELSARHSVGLGDLPRLDDDDAVREALRRADAADLTAQLPAGLDTTLGTAYAAGTELSGGQWQKLALARGFMRRTPLLLVLDEPSSALDPQAEHLLFERLATTAKQAGQASGAVTVFISHRFSTVASADLIVVLAQGQVVETGDHRSLLAAGGRYAQLYREQAQAYG
ncbi:MULTISPECIES: ABC transporter ATP-binding protein [Micromonospora]|uniref:ATP-binding cassette, subfamily B n=1 Tax=Micromonospora yangpuensis TaxID=683228 RepID=A0A1C6TX38_9ACTN|nr:ABC transporter ATP-binding protein [Micromonospora yangpuensis]GGM01864.1 ABC transporter permease [Micromonospora yangpuensis]SCL46380.1 ATP-binding cassette, subfamily B [Micromonospora yangpuensis]